MAISEISIGLVFDPQEFAYLTKHTFRGITISDRGDGWNVVLRAYDRKQQAVYAMQTAEHPADGLLQLINALSGRGGESLWRLDKYAR